MDSRVLVTGGNGFIGKQLLPLLQNESYEIHAISREVKNNYPDNIIWHQADLLNFDSISKLLSKVKPDKLIHLAWDVTPGKYLESESNFQGLNAGLNLFKEFIQNGGTRIVGAGTCYEYDIRYGYLQEDFTPRNPLTYYGLCKKHLFDITQAYCKKKNVEFAWGRIFYVFGPHEYESRFIPSMIRSYLQGVTAQVSHGYQIRDYLYVKDVARVFSSLCSSQYNGAVNIGSGQPVNLRYLVDIIREIIGDAFVVHYSEHFPSDDEIPLILADSKKIRDKLKWSPHYSLYDGLKETIDWWIDSYKK